MTDASGYEYTVSFNVVVGTPASTSIANAPPGQADWTSPQLIASAVVTNTTSGRNAPYQGFKVAAYWTVPSTVCAEHFNSADPPPILLPDGNTLCPLARSLIGYDTLGTLVSGQIAAGQEASVSGSSSDSSFQRVTETEAGQLKAATARPPDGWIAIVDLPSGMGSPAEVAWNVYANGAGEKFHTQAHVLASRSLPAFCADLGCG